ncbi:MAG: peptide/nickel transport system substrate-binding protein [Acidimicrobiaceae bacterium]|nr:peptide/nickel transport system substrate-binding protein [Acidimicrobiaceae bacterium]
MPGALSLVVALVLLAGLAGCDKKSDSGTAAKEAKPRPGGVLRVGVTRVGSLDPAQARTVEQLLVADQLFDSLTTPHPVTLEPKPALASRWEASADQRQWDFFLRPGAVFANGRPVTSADVKYTLERIVRPQTASPAADLLQPVTGYAALQNGSAPELAGVTTPSPEQVHVALDMPLSVLAEILSSPVFGVVPKEAVEAVPPAPAFGEQPVGSGPFQFASTKGDVVSLTPVKGRTAYVQRLDFRQFDDVAASYRAFAAGDVDWSRVPPDEVAAAGARYGDKAFRPYLAELFYGFNLKSTKFADPRFREAIVHAIDRDAIAKAVYGSTVLAMNGLVVAGVPGHVDRACAATCAHDVARARALVAEVFAGQPPPEVFLDYDEDETQTAVAKAIQAGLKDAGVTATLRAKPLKDYQAFAVSGQQELFRLGWIGAYPSADAFLPPLFATGSPSNLTGFSVPAVDQAFAAARAEPDPGKRLGLYQDAERQILALTPVIPIAQFQLHSVVADGVHRLTPTAAGTFDASVVWLSRRG